jgi:hypothetical protein
LAEALLINGLPNEALATEEKALQLEPDSPLITDRIKRFQEAAQQGKPPGPD